MNNNPHILIAGGTGLIGTRLTTLLLKENFAVSYLSRKAGTINGIKVYKWDTENKSIDPAALDGITHIVNLAGEPIAGNRWTKSFKEKIIKSRIDASATILNALNTIPNSVESIIAASAIGIYGDRGEELLTENSKAGNDFLADTVLKWEESYNEFNQRVVLLRTGIVLSKNGGALRPMAKPIKFGITPILGNGNQYMSWIHIDDICGLYIYAIKSKNMHGVYNAVAINPVTHIQFMNTLRDVINKFSIKINVPSFALNIIMGEQKEIVLDSNNVSASKALNSGYIFRYTDLNKALREIYAG